MPQSQEIEGTPESTREYLHSGSDTLNVHFGWLHNIVMVDMDGRALFLSVQDAPDCPIGGQEPLFGKTLACAIGDGLLEFIQAPFEQEIRAASVCVQAAQDGARDDAARRDTVLAAILRVAQLSHYTRAFLPELLDATPETCADYFDYVTHLQEEYRTFVAAAFAQSPHEADIKGMSAATRFYFYCMINDTQHTHSLRRRVVCRRVTRCMGNTKGGVFTEDVTEGLPPAKYRQYLEVCAGMQKHGRTEQNNFERAYDLPATFTDLNEVMPAMVQTEYELSRLDEMLALEFEQMLRLDLRVKKCKNCGRFFVLKGNYPTDYCDKIAPGQKKPCQHIAATSNYARKLSECPALAHYNKEYKRLHARMRTGSLDPALFAQWKKRAKALRDDCVAGKLSEQQFADMLEELRPR
ncbi:MAG: DUF6076 domain-containing protein [Acetanaerobacterium sp.]